MNMAVWQERLLAQEKTSPKDVRTEWDRDYGRLIHSPSFRRLQAKTQVLGLGESDFYRTRLTHSMEVSQIGTGIVQWLQFHHKKDPEILDWLPDFSLMSSVCLAHDLGHPPFGHGGEVALNICMRNYGGFEGNGQTLRILTKLDKYTEKNGLNPTRRLLLGVLKYPASYQNTVQEKSYGQLSSPLWLSKTKEQQPPKCYLDEERKVVSWILEPLTEKERQLFTSLSPNKTKHLRPSYKSFDASIMELADDISYSLHDLEDAISLKLIIREDWNKHNKGTNHLFLAAQLDANELGDQLFSEQSYQRKKAIGQLIHALITSIKIDKNILPEAETPLIKWNAVMHYDYEKLMNHIFELVLNKVIKSPNVQQLEFKGQKLVIELFEALKSDPERLLPLDTRARYGQAKNDKEKMRTICDFIAGMTDEFASRFYDKLYYPHKGSIFDHM